MKTYTVEIDDNGTKRWYFNDQLHREDGPAVEFANGEKLWYLNGDFHRTDGPAIEHTDGSKFWYLNDLFHNKPSVIKDLEEVAKKHGYKLVKE